MGVDFIAFTSSASFLGVFLSLDSYYSTGLITLTSSLISLRTTFFSVLCSVTSGWVYCSPSGVALSLFIIDLIWFVRALYKVVLTPDLPTVSRFNLFDSSCHWRKDDFDFCSILVFYFFNVFREDGFSVFASVF